MRGDTASVRRRLPPLVACQRLCRAAAGFAGLSGFALARGEVLEGELLPGKSFATYVGKFCYDYGDAEDQVGEVRLELFREGTRVEPNSGKLYFAIFDDEKKHWKQARRKWESSTCEEKRQDASLITEMEVWSPRQDTVYEIRIREHLRPRFWYFTFINCGSEFDAPLRYKIHAQNLLLGWQTEFSKDHTGIFYVYIVATVVFCAAFLMTDRVSRQLQGSSQGPTLREHPYLQLLLLAYVASAASCALFLLHYGLFMHNGHGSLRLRFLAVLASIVANCTIFLIAILSSVGWAISYTSLPCRRIFLSLVALVGVSSAMCELHAETMIDQSTKLYSYQSSAGVLLLMLKIFTFCWFAFQVRSTYDEEPDVNRRRFYKLLGWSMSGWSLNVPVTVILAFEISPSYRYKIVTTVDIIARFVGLVLLSQLFCGPLSPITAENTFSSGQKHGTANGDFGQMMD